MKVGSFLTVLAIFLAQTACSPSDHAVLEAASLTVSPCDNDEDRTFAPFRLEANFLRWLQDDGVGQIEMRTGYRARTLSDTMVLQVLDLDTVSRRWAEDPEVSLPLDDTLLRLSVLLLSTCPDAAQAIVGRGGGVRFTKFDTSVGGHIAGTATFDLVDARPKDAAVMATGATLEFEFEVRRGAAYEDYTR